MGDRRRDPGEQAVSAGAVSLEIRDAWAKFAGYSVSERTSYSGWNDFTLDMCGIEQHHADMSVAQDHGDGDAPNDRKTQPADGLAGRRILIVEDDSFIALALEEILGEHGLVIVGAAKNVSAALHLAASERLDIALLDVNIGPEKVDPVADLLAGRDCPFVFTTGYGRAGLPEAHSSRAIVEKPFYIDELINALREELRRCAQTE